MPRGRLYAHAHSLNDVRSHHKKGYHPPQPQRKNEFKENRRQNEPYFMIPFVPGLITTYPMDMCRLCVWIVRSCDKKGGAVYELKYKSSLCEFHGHFDNVIL